MEVVFIFYNREVKIIKKLLENVKKEDLQKRVFIERAFAIEDHSQTKVYLLKKNLNSLRKKEFLFFSTF